MKTENIIKQPLTTFIIPTINRPTLARAMVSATASGALPEVQIDIDNDRSEARNRAIRRGITPWVSMLDDDDTVTQDYVERLQEELLKHPSADVVIFRAYFLHGVILPAWPVVEEGNIGISFSAKRDLLIKYPFINEPHEDYNLIKRLELSGANIVFSPYLTYRVRH